jgi:creatinine amidohydrolase/Fe(II)-dependent formamide hydrolase-like protein
MTIKNKIRWEEMLPHEFVETRDRCPVCYMAYGLAEPHGAYNALGLDWIKAYKLVEAAATTHGGMIAPPLAWHMQEIPEFHDDGQGNGWLCEVGVKQPLASSLPADLFYRMVFYNLRAMDARGFHAVVLVTGHYGGIEKILRRICEYYLRQTRSPLRVAAIADWECIDRALPYRGDHAGVVETSQLMALAPGMTDLSRRTCDEDLGTRFAGFVDFENGEIPSTETGQKIVESQVRNLGDIARELLKDYCPTPDHSAPDLNETEEIWTSFERLTRKYWTVTYEEYKHGKRLEFPDWEDLEGKQFES